MKGYPLLFLDQMQEVDQACYDPIDGPYSYSGSASTSVSGRPCLNWISPAVLKDNVR